MLSLCNLLYIPILTHSTHIFKQQNHLFMCFSNLATFHLHQTLLSRFVLPEVKQMLVMTWTPWYIDEENLKDLNNIYTLAL